MRLYYCDVMYSTSVWSAVICHVLCVCVMFPGLDVDGVYRVSGNVAQMQRLRYLVDQSTYTNTQQHYIPEFIAKSTPQRTTFSDLFILIVTVLAIFDCKYFEI